MKVQTLLMQYILNENGLVKYSSLLGVLVSNKVPKAKEKLALWMEKHHYLFEEVVTGFYFVDKGLVRGLQTFSEEELHALRIVCLSEVDNGTRLVGRKIKSAKQKLLGVRHWSAFALDKRALLSKIDSLKETECVQLYNELVEEVLSYA